MLENGVLEGLSALQSSGYLLVIVSNQPGLSMGLFSENDLHILITFLSDMFEKNDIIIDRFYYCPHFPAKDVGNDLHYCLCRKPEPGLLFRAAEELDIDLQQSWMIGDILNDVEAGKRAGCKTILINNGNETEWLKNQYRVPDYTADDFLDASNYIFIKTMIKNA